MRVTQLLSATMGSGLPHWLGAWALEEELKKYQIKTFFFEMLRFALEQEIIHNNICIHKCYLGGSCALNDTKLTGKLVLQFNKCITHNHTHYMGEAACQALNEALTCISSIHSFTHPTNM